MFNSIVSMLKIGIPIRKIARVRIAVVSDTHIGLCRTPVAEITGHPYRSLPDT